MFERQHRELGAPLPYLPHLFSSSHSDQEPVLPHPEYRDVKG